MPLEHSKSKGAFNRNVSTLMHEAKAGTSTHVKSPQQALAIAYSIKRRGRAGGGGFDMAKGPKLNTSGPMAVPERMMMRSMTRGALLTATPGRADLHKTSVPSGSYVIPADVVSGRGQGNTLAGASELHNLFGMGPYGSAGSKLHTGRAPKMPAAPKMSMGVAAGGGKTGDSVGEPVPVNLSGGEIVVPPENLIKTFRRLFPNKAYTLKQIHSIMDSWVLHERKTHRKTLAKLPRPAKD